MKQILFNWLMVFILPTVIGLVLRLSLFRAGKGWWITLGLVMLAAVSWALFDLTPGFSNEAHGIVTAQISGCAAGALLVEIAVRLRKILEKRR